MHQEIITTFNYEALDAETRIVVQQKTGEIKERVENIKRNWAEIGQRLIEIKARLAYGQWKYWLRAEFGWSQDTAENLMRVAGWLDQNPKFSDSANLLPKSAMYLLSMPSTPEAARDDVYRLLADGKKPTVEGVKDIIAAHKPLPPEPAPTPVTAGDTPAPDDQALHAAGVDDSQSPDERPVTRLDDGRMRTADGLILRYIPGADRGWCPRCGDYTNFMLVGQDTWACKKCDWRVQDDAIRIWEPEPPDPTPTRPIATPAIVSDNMLADLQEAQRLLRKWWERLPSASQTRTYVDQALVNVGKAINSAGKAPASAAFGKPTERIHQ